MFFNIIGMLGDCFILFAYYLLQTKRINSEDIRFSLMNILGSALIIISLFHDWNLPSFIIELSWIIISFSGIIKTKQLTKEKTKKEIKILITDIKTIFYSYKEKIKKYFNYIENKIAERLS